MFARLMRIYKQREVLALTLTVLLAELVVGTYHPYFALFATSLGASVALVGALVSVQTLSRTVNCLAMGALSDRVGRKSIVVFSMGLFALSVAGMTLFESPAPLFITQIMIGAAHAGAFDIGIGYLGDVVPEQDRGPAIGVYTTVMGLGFGLGSALGGALVGDANDYLLAFRVTAMAAAAAVAVSTWGLRHHRGEVDDAGADRLAMGQRLRSTAAPMAAAWRNRLLMSGAVLNVLKMAWFAVVGGGFLSLYMRANGISAEAIGLIFGLRAIVSSAARLPAGLLTRRWPSYWIIVAATATTMVGFWLLPALRSRAGLTVFVVIEGAMFGALMSVGNAFVAENARPGNLGSALGLYGTIGGAGSTLLSLLVGIVAERSNLPVMFAFMGGVLALGIAISLWVRRAGLDTEQAEAAEPTL